MHPSIARLHAAANGSARLQPLALHGRGSHADSFKGDLQLVRGRHREIQLLKSDDTSGPVFHQNDLIPRFFTHVFLLRVPKPYGQGIPSTVVENLYLLHTRSPSLIASVGYVVMRN